MPRIALALILALTVPLLPSTACQAAEEPVDWDMVTRIREEGFRRSQVMDTIEHLSDNIGPRLTGSPQMKEANDWTRGRLAEWGLSNAHLESFEFGRGWSFSRASVHMTAPAQTPLLALPKAWTPGTKGKARGEVIEVEISSKKDFDTYRGKLKGRILLLPPSNRESGRRGGGNADDPPSRRFSSDELDELEHFEIPDGRPSEFRQRFLKRRELRKAMNEFLAEEKALATLEVSSRKNGVLRVGGGGSREKGESVGVTALVLSVEHFQRIQRLLAADRTVELEIEIKAEFHDEDPNAYNTVAELPGTDLAEQVVMAGGHLDSWHTGTGTTDNGASCAVMMEAMRILKALEVEPRRTIRIALWGGEEQGLLGSRAYVEEHFASRPEAEEGEEDNPFEPRWPLTLKSDHALLSGYFNLDNGAGKLRGIYTQENAAVKPIFEAWLRPFEDLGAESVTLRNTRGTDHLAFDSVGLPGFQFIQDRLDYFSRTHHTNLDVLEAIEEEDLKQAAVIIASFLYHAAMRDEPLPRKPLPQEPPKEEKEKEKGDESGAG